MNASSEIRTHDPSVRAGEDGSCLRPRGHRDRHRCAWKCSIRVLAVPHIPVQTLVKMSMVTQVIVQLTFVEGFCKLGFPLHN
jgi:hypothetical protein